MEAIRVEHLDTETIQTVNDIMGMFKKLFKGEGRLTLIISGGNVSSFETSTKTPNRRRKKLAS